MELKIINGEKTLVETVEQVVDPELLEAQVSGALAQADALEAQAAECRAKAAEMQAKLDGNKSAVEEVKAERVAKLEAVALEAAEEEVKEVIIKR